MPATEEASATLTDEFYLAHADEVSRVAAGAWKGSSLYSVEDVEQAIWEHVAANWKYFAAANAESISLFMKRAARGFVRKERVDYMYFTGAFVYTPKLVAQFLDTCAWKPLEEVPDIDARVDMQEAFARLSQSAPAQADAVFRRYGMGGDLTASEMKNAQRGVDSICHRLNSGLRLQAEAIEVAISREN
jgi:hypothetical protein